MAEPTEGSFKDLLYVSFSVSGITSIPDKMFMNCTKIISFEGSFSDCNNLTTIGDNAFANCSSVESFRITFQNCSNLTTIGDNAFANCQNVISYQGTFENCTNLTGHAPELWESGTNSEENDYCGTPNGNSCFYNCTKLENYDEIPFYWKQAPK